jgi:hypothetical protein
MVNVEGTVYAPEPYKDGFRISHADMFVYAEPIFELNVRIGFAVVRTFRSNDSLVLSDRFNLNILAKRRKYLNELKKLGVELNEGPLQALGEAVCEAQRNAEIKISSTRKAFEHSNNQAPAPAASLEELAVAAGGLLGHRNVLSYVGEVAGKRGYAGDTRPVCLVYLSIASRSLARPLNTAVVSESASGKNATIDAARELHPPEAVVEIRAGSARAAIYSTADYEHKVVLFAEADSIPDDGPAASAIRSLATDNCLTYDVVEQDPETKKFTTRHIEKPGPTGLLTTSTRTLTAQLNTRLLEMGLADDAEQTRRVMRAHAHKVRPPAGEPPALDPLQAFGRYIAQRAAGLRGVDIPFAKLLAEITPAGAVRMRRDFRQLLTVIQTSALVHIVHRTITADDWLVATVEDYATARGLLLPVFDALAAEGVTPAIRQTVEAVGVDENNVTQAMLKQRLELSAATISWRVGRALDGGWLVDEAPRRSRSKLLRRGAPLPQEISALPEVEEVQRLFECSNAKRGEGLDPTQLVAAPEDGTVAEARSPAVSIAKNGALPCSRNGPPAARVEGTVAEKLPATPPTSFASLNLTAEAQVLLETAAAHRGVPAHLTASLKRIAADNGVQVTTDMTPSMVIVALLAVGAGIRTAANGTATTTELPAIACEDDDDIVFKEHGG